MIIISVFIGVCKSLPRKICEKNVNFQSGYNNETESPKLKRVISEFTFFIRFNLIVPIFFSSLDIRIPILGIPPGKRTTIILTADNPKFFFFMSFRFHMTNRTFVSIVSSIIHYNKTVAEKVTKVRDVKKLYYFSHSFVRLLSYSKL